MSAEHLECESRLKEVLGKLLGWLSHLPSEEMEAQKGEGPFYDTSGPGISSECLAKVLTPTPGKNVPRARYGPLPALAYLAQSL